jgi:hypothetical protein
MIQIIKSVLSIAGVGLLIGIAYAAAGEWGLITLAVIAIIVGLLRLIPPLFWTIFFAVGFAILIFGH